MIWPYAIGGILAVAILWILRMRLILWSYELVVYRGLTATELRPLIGSWGPWLEKRGKIVISHEATDAEVDLRKFRYKGRPDALVYRFRNADATRKCFDAVKDAFDGALIDYRIALTPRRKRPRAIEVDLEAEDLFMPVAALHLIETTFVASENLRQTDFLSVARGK